MNDKSDVSLEQHVRLFCGLAFDTGNLLLDMHMCASMGHHTTTGWGQSTGHQKLVDGFVALVEREPQRSAPSGGRLQAGQGYRTGRFAHLRWKAFTAIFNVSIETELPCIFVEPGVIEQLQGMVPPRSS